MKMLREKYKDQVKKTVKFEVKDTIPVTGTIDSADQGKLGSEDKEEARKAREKVDKGIVKDEEKAIDDSNKPLDVAKKDELKPPKEKGITEKAELAEKELTAAAREKLPDSAFVYPKERKYPIHDIAHAKNALARSSGKGEEAKVKAAVYKKYPSLKEGAVEEGKGFLAQRLRESLERKRTYGLKEKVLKGPLSEAAEDDQNPDDENLLAFRTGEGDSEENVAPVVDGDIDRAAENAWNLVKAWHQLIEDIGQFGVDDAAATDYPFDVSMDDADVFTWIQNIRSELGKKKRARSAAV